MTIKQRLEALTLKVNSPERLAVFQTMGKEHYADAEFLNLLVEALIDIYTNYIPFITVETLEDIVFPAKKAIYEVLADTAVMDDEPRIQWYYSDGTATTPGELLAIIMDKLTDIIS